MVVVRLQSWGSVVLPLRLSVEERLKCQPMTVKRMKHHSLKTRRMILP